MTSSGQTLLDDDSSPYNSARLSLDSGPGPAPVHRGYAALGRAHSPIDNLYRDPHPGSTDPTQTPLGDTQPTPQPTRQNTLQGTAPGGPPAASRLLLFEHQGTSSRDLERQAPGRLLVKARVASVMAYLVPVQQTYERLSNGIATGRLQLNSPGRFVGQGTDGVFRNLMAKPDTEAHRTQQEQHPPTYEEAAADSLPEYWEATMISPMYQDEVFVQGLPVGNIANFIWNIVVTVAFQTVGFVLCYLLHTSHAAKQGTRVGLGVYMIMYGLSVIPANLGHPERIPTRYQPADPNAFDILKLTSIKQGSRVDTYLLGFLPSADAASSGALAPLFAYSIIALGVFVIVKAFADCYRVKQDEKRILAPQAQAAEEMHSTTEEVNNPPPE